MNRIQLTEKSALFSVPVAHSENCVVIFCIEKRGVLWDKILFYFPEYHHKRKPELKKNSTDFESYFHTSLTTRCELNFS